jgi:hypothetical protein
MNPVQAFETVHPAESDIFDSHEFTGFVSHLRHNLRTSLGRLPKPFNCFATSYLDQRYSRSSHRALLGEQLPFLLSDLLGVPPPEAVPVAVGWLHIYLSVLALDDLIDRPSKEQESLLFLAPILQQRGTTLLTQLSASPATTAACIERAFLETASAGYKELRDHRGKITPFSPHQLRSVGKKMALSSVLLSSLLSKAEHIHKGELTTLERSLRRLQTAIQILDDLTDVKEDMQKRQLSLPLTRALTRMGKTVASIPNRLSFKTLVETGALEDTLRLASREFAAVQRLLGPISRNRPSSAVLHINWLAIKTEQLAKEAHCLAGLIAQPKKAGLHQSALKQLERNLLVVAQTS